MCTGATRSTGPACALRCFTMPETWLKPVCIVHVPKVALKTPFLMFAEHRVWGAALAMCIALYKSTALMDLPVPCRELSNACSQLAAAPCVAPMQG